MIHSGYSNSTPHILLTPDWIEEMRAGTNEEQQKQVLFKLLGSSNTPFEYMDLVWSDDDNGFKFDMPRTVLDYIVDHKHRWFADKVAWFLLEVADDHVRFGDDPTWLIQADIPEMIEDPAIEIALWDMFWEGHALFVMELMNHYNWNAHFAQGLNERAEELAKDNDPDSYLYTAAAYLIEAGELDSDEIETSSARQLAAGWHAKEAGDYDRAISTLLDFSGNFPTVAQQRIRVDLAFCYLQIGWHGIALEWILEALKHDPADVELTVLQAQIMAVDAKRLQRIEDASRKTFHYLTEPALTALSQAVYLYQFYGRMLHDYSPVISGYARAVEIQLNHTYLPQLRLWIASHGIADERGKRYIFAENRKVYSDVDEHNMTLGKWSKLLEKYDRQTARNEPGTLYHCLHKEYGISIGLDAIADSGKLLAETAKIRNDASHKTVHDWEKVLRIRQIVIAENAFTFIFAPGVGF